MLRSSLLVLTLTAPALAQEREAESGDRVVYKQVTELDYEEREITAAVERPGVELIDERARASFASLLRLRQEFRAEIAESVDAVK